MSIFFGITYLALLYILPGNLISILTNNASCMIIGPLQIKMKYMNYLQVLIDLEL